MENYYFIHFTVELWEIILCNTTMTQYRLSGMKKICLNELLKLIDFLLVIISAELGEKCSEWWTRYTSMISESLTEGQCFVGFRKTSIFKNRIFKYFQMAIVVCVNNNYFSWWFIKIIWAYIFCNSWYTFLFQSYSFVL